MFPFPWNFCHLFFNLGPFFKQRHCCWVDQLHFFRFFIHPNLHNFTKMVNNTNTLIRYSLNEKYILQRYLQGEPKNILYNTISDCWCCPLSPHMYILPSCNLLVDLCHVGNATSKLVLHNLNQELENSSKLNVSKTVHTNLHLQHYWLWATYLDFAQLPNASHAISPQIITPKPMKLCNSWLP